MTLFEHYKAISSELGEQVETVVKTPFFWVLIFLLLGSLVLTYNSSSQNRLSGSLINTIRMFGTFLIDAFNSIVLACKSLFGFLDVLRLLLFGHLGRSTLYVLTNYAIIFLSMASFATTMQGLFSLIGWIGILVSFGIQVTELVSVTGIITCCVPQKFKPKETVRYTYCPMPAQGGEGPSNGSRAASEPAEEMKNFSPKDSETGFKMADESTEGSLDKEKKAKYKWGKAKRALLPCALLFAYIASCFFSYCYIFNAVVMPGIAYDDYIESIDLVNQETEAYEKELTRYRTELANGLTRFLNEISTYARLAENNIALIDAQIQSRESEKSSLEEDLREIADAIAQLDPDSEGAKSLSEGQTSISNRLKEIQDELSRLRAAKSSSEYVLYQAIQLLLQYLADPLYLYENNIDEGTGISETRRQDVETAFNTVMLQGYPPYSIEISVDSDQIRTAFNNYTMLCRYYAMHNNSGLNLSGSGEDDSNSVDALLAQRSEIIAQYNDIQTSKSISEDEEYRSTGTAADYLNEETRKLLVAAMRAIEDVPRFSAVGELWPDNTLTETGGIHPVEPGIAGHLETLNKEYRTVNGQLTLQERAISKLFSANKKMAWFSLIIAMGLDLIIISLCFLRGREYYTNNVRNRRQMISLLFVTASTEEETRQSRNGRLVILAGAVLGCLIYILYFKIYPGAAGSSAITAFILIVGGIMLISLLQSLQAVLKPVQNGTAHQSAPDVDLINKRIRKSAYTLLNHDLHEAPFRKCCTIRRPKKGRLETASSYYEQEDKLWHELEDHKIRLFTLTNEDYDIITTCESVGMEYFVFEDDIAQAGLKYPFAVLETFALVYPVVIPMSQPENKISGSEEPQYRLRSAYLLTQEFVRLLYECILLRTVLGGNLEYSMEDDILDYEREDDNED